MININQDRILNHLLENGIINKVEQEAIESEHELSKERIGNILVKNGFVTRKQIAHLLNHDLDPAVLVNPIEVEEVEPDILLKTRTMILAVTTDKVYLGSSSPRSFVASHLARYFPGREFVFRPYDPDILAHHLQYIDQQINNRNNLDGILRDAVIRGASDIHLVPKEDNYALMYRLLGVRKLIKHISYQQGQYIASQAKDRGSMDIAEKRVPQDGGFRAQIVDRSVDFRVSSLTTVNGEVIVIRILDAERVNPDLQKLGMSRSTLDEWRKTIGYVNGICLIVGPTGSGKSTTMNATVREIDRFGKAIYTVEDPVELRLALLNQVETNGAIGLDFNRALRAFMRADPDVIIVGEIRDFETAELAINAAKTGHLVFATLHSDSPQAAIGRLKTMGLNTEQFSSQLRGVLSQQLVRTLCPACLGKDDNCSTCAGSRYTSRQLIAEAVHFKNAGEVLAAERGERWWPSIVDDSRRVMEANITDYAEISRVLGTQLNAGSEEKIKGDV